jgi:hypothetical protein
MHRPKIFGREASRHVVDPRSLQLHGGIEGALPLLGQDDELGPAVVRVGLEFDKALMMKIIDDALNVLAIAAQVAREPSDWLRPFGGHDGAEHLPAGAGQTKRRDQPIPGRQEKAIQSKQVEDQSAEGFACRRSRWLLHMERKIPIDIMVSTSVYDYGVKLTL